MAAALEVAWPDVEMHGVVVTRYGHAVATQKIRIVEASHPVSDAMSEMASMLMLEQVKNLNADDCVIALISGGGRRYWPCRVRESPGGQTGAQPRVVAKRGDDY
jgi:hydroxypyruvate reductase